MRKLTALATTALLLTLGASTAQASPSISVPDQMRVELCEHFNAGFTIDDSVSVQAALFGDEAGEELRRIAEQVEADGC